jgi:hypothetical protein
VLYIGLARDLSVRFGQHNGLVRMSERGCKRAQVSAWFDTHDDLGYAAFVASSVAQVSVGRQKGTTTEAFWDEESDVFYDYPEEGLDEIRQTEGILIGAYVARHHQLPPWNKIGGARLQPHLITPGGYALLDIATGRVDCLLVARRTIRGLSADVNAAEHEMTLHTGRIGAIEDTWGTGISSPVIWNALVRRANDPSWDPAGSGALLEATKRLIQTRYPLEVPPPPAWKDTAQRLRRLPGTTPLSDSNDAPEDARWHLMWADSGLAQLIAAGQDRLFCRACAGDLCPRRRRRQPARLLVHAGRRAPRRTSRPGPAGAKLRQEVDTRRPARRDARRPARRGRARLRCGQEHGRHAARACGCRE